MRLIALGVPDPLKASEEKLPFRTRQTQFPDFFPGQTQLLKKNPTGYSLIFFVTIQKVNCTLFNGIRKIRGAKGAFPGVFIVGYESVD
jgi:hypothetical protein